MERYTNKVHSHTQVVTAEVENSTLHFQIQQADCSGVKMCPEPGCNTAVAKKQAVNTCSKHNNGLRNLVVSKKCSATFIIVKPLEEDDH